MGHEGNYCRCSRPVLLAPADIPLVEYHSSGGGGDGQQQVSLMMEKALFLNKKKDTCYLLDIINFKTLYILAEISISIFFKFNYI